MSEATDKIAAMCAQAAVDARGDADLMGELVERLAYWLGFSVAIACRGDQAEMDTVLAGLEQYVAETATKIAPLGRST